MRNRTRNHRPGGAVRAAQAALAGFLLLALNVVAPSAVLAAPASNAGEPEIAGFIVRYAPGTQVRDRNGLATGAGALRNVALAPGIAIGFGLRTVRLPAPVTVAQAEALAAALEKAPEVISAEPDYVIRLDTSVVPAQTLSASVTQPSPTWGLDRIDQVTLPLDGAYNYESDGSGVTAYIVDTGIRASHNEFAGRVQRGADCTSGTCVQGGNVDGHGHGTHVSGTVGGTTYGVAKKVTLIPVQVLNAAGSGTNSGVIAGLNWIVTHHTSGPAVANMSLGGASSAALDAAVNAAINDGVTVVVASGNDKKDACNQSPARVPAAITVNASTSSDTYASFTNYGSCTDIYAPGLDILSASKASDSAATTMSGTSMATPHVAGMAARVLEENPTWTPAQVWSAIQGNATVVPFNRAANDPNLLLYAIPGPPPAPLTSVTPNSGPATGGNPVTITGTGFAADSTVWFGGVAASASFISETEIFATSPASTALGAVAVTVASPSGNSSLARAFTYTAVAQDPLSVSNVTTAAATTSAITLTAAGGSGSGAVTFAATGDGCSVSGTKLTATKTTTCTVTATKAASGIYTAVRSAPQEFSFTFTGKVQAALKITTSTRAVPASRTLTLKTSGGSGSGAVSYELAGAQQHCRITGAKLSVTAPGKCTVVAVKAGDGTYLEAKSAAVTFAFNGVAQSRLTISNSSKTGKVGTAITLTTRGGSGSGAVTYTATGAGCSVDGAQLSRSSAGTCSVTATKAASGSYNAATSAKVTFTFRK